MSVLAQVQSGTTPAPRRVMLYGTHGIGKSTFGAMAERPIFIQTEDGLGEIDCDKFPLATSYADVLAQLGALYTDDHNYATVVIDTLDWLERLIFAEVCRKRGVESIEDIGYQKGYTFALNQWREIVAGLDALRRQRGMSIILLAHAQVERVNNPETEPYDRYAPRLHRLASAYIQEWCDEVLFASYKVFTKSTDEGFNRTRHQGIGNGERLIRTTERPTHLAKNRLNLPDELPMLYSAYAQYLPGAGSRDSSVTTPQPSGATIDG